jgi:hypothetical protein
MVAPHMTTDLGLELHHDYWTRWPVTRPLTIVVDVSRHTWLHQPPSAPGPASGSQLRGVLRLGRSLRALVELSVGFTQGARQLGEPRAAEQRDPEVLALLADFSC